MQGQTGSFGMVEHCGTYLSPGLRRFDCEIEHIQYLCLAPCGCRVLFLVASPPCETVVQSCHKPPFSNTKAANIADDFDYSLQRFKQTIL